MKLDPIMEVLLRALEIAEKNNWTKPVKSVEDLWWALWRISRVKGPRHIDDDPDNPAVCRRIWILDELRDYGREHNNCYEYEAAVQSFVYINLTGATWDYLAKFPKDPETMPHLSGLEFGKHWDKMFNEILEIQKLTHQANQHSGINTDF